MTIEFVYPCPRGAGLLAVVLALAALQAPAQITGGSAQSTLETECLNLNLRYDSGKESDAQFELEAKRMLAHLGDSGNRSTCKGMTLSCLALALLRLDKLEEARKAARDSIDILQRSPDSNYTLLRQSIGVLATVALFRNNVAEAERQAARLRPLPASEKGRALESGLLMEIALHQNRPNDAVLLGKEAIAHWDRAGYRTDVALENDLINLGTGLVLCKRTLEAIPFLERALEMPGQIPAFPEHATANALMGFVQWQARHGTAAADPYFRSALYWLAQVPDQQKPKVGRAIYTLYLGYLEKTGRRQEAKLVRAKRDSFGPDPAQMVVDYSGSAPFRE